VTRVLYPFRDDHPQAALARRQMTGGGTLVSFDVAGGKEAAFALANALEIVKISNNLGDAKSLVTHPATTTHQRLTPEARAALGIGEGMLRLSVGIEDCDDLLYDLKRGLSPRGGSDVPRRSPGRRSSSTMTSPRAYLDYNATAPLRPRAREAMLAALDRLGNPPRSTPRGGRRGGCWRARGEKSRRAWDGGAQPRFHQRRDRGRQSRGDAAFARGARFRPFRFAAAFRRRASLRP